MFSKQIVVSERADSVVGAGASTCSYAVSGKPSRRLRLDPGHGCCDAARIPIEIKDIVKSVAGVVGTAAGTAVGVAAGAAAALAGQPIGKRDKGPASFDAKAEELYWREHFAAEPYYDSNFAFEDYSPAWRTGWEGRQSRLLWEQAREAARAAFERRA